MRAEPFAVLLYLCSLALSCLWGMLLQARRARRRHGGYLPPRVFTFTSRPTGIASPTGAVDLLGTPEGFSSTGQPGGAWAVPEGPPMQAWPSSWPAHIASGSGTDGDRGPLPRDFAGSHD